MKGEYLTVALQISGDDDDKTGVLVLALLTSAPGLICDVEVWSEFETLGGNGRQRQIQGTRFSF